MTKKIVIFLISFAFLHFVAGASNLDAETFQIKIYLLKVIIEFLQCYRKLFKFKFE